MAHKIIIEVRRGDTVPMAAKWLKDETRVIKEWQEPYPENSGWIGMETKKEIAVFDIFELPLNDA